MNNALAVLDHGNATAGSMAGWPFEQALAKQDKLVLDLCGCSSSQTLCTPFGFRMFKIASSTGRPLTASASLHNHHNTPKGRKMDRDGHYVRTSRTWTASDEL